VRLWKDPPTLFAHTLAVTHDNPLAEYLLGQTLQTSEAAAAMPHLRRAIALTQRGERASMPDWYPQAYVALGNATLIKAQKLPETSPTRVALVREATADYLQALAIDPNAAHARNNLAVAAAMMPRK
jgi:tetratricopeptide (TPR) repeat protein